MPDCGKILNRAKNSAKSLRFDEVCQLAECFGFVFARQEGSHKTYKRAGFPRSMTFQNDNGKAKPYQVRQLLLAISQLNELESEAEEDYESK